MNWIIILLAFIAGVVGTGLGGIVGAFMKNKGARVMGRVLNFAGGVMAGVVAFEMIPEAIASSQSVGKIGGIALAVGTTVGGMIAIFAINKLLDFVESKRHKIKLISAGKAFILKTPTSPQKQRKSMLKAGAVMLIAIALHNLPEGMAIGASGMLGTETGIIIAFIIALHNIPEGMAISAPLVSGGVKSWIAILLTAIAGGATVLGAAIGLAVGGLGEIATGVCLALASGAMLYVTFCEILPQSARMNDGDVPSVSMLVGLIISVILVFVL